MFMNRMFNMYTVWHTFSTVQFEQITELLNCLWIESYYLFPREILYVFLACSIGSSYICMLSLSWLTFDNTIWLTFPDTIINWHQSNIMNVSMAVFSGWRLFKALLQIHELKRSKTYIHVLYIGPNCLIPSMIWWKMWVVMFWRDTGKSLSNRAKALFSFISISSRSSKLWISLHISCMLSSRIKVLSFDRLLTFHEDSILVFLAKPAASSHETSYFLALRIRA